MKNKNILIAVVSVLLFSTYSHAQEPGEWTQPKDHPCYQGIKVSVVNMGHSKDPAGYMWGIRFFNDKYSLPVSFKYKLSIGEKVTSKEDWQAVGNLGKGQDYSDAHDKFTAWTYASSSETWYVYIWDVCFHDMRCGGADECFAECDKTAGKENQLCGLSEEYKPTPGSNQLSLLQGTAVAPEEEEPEDKGPADKWEADDKTGELQVIKKEDGLLIKLEGEKEYRFFKKIGDKTYRHEEGKDFDIIKFSTDDKFSYWHNGELQNHYTLVTEDDGSESKVRSGLWSKSLSNSMVRITVTKDGLTYHYINNSSDDGSPFYKRISATEYRRDDPDGIHFCTIKLKEDGKLSYLCSDKPGSFVGVGSDILTFISDDYEDTLSTNGDNYYKGTKYWDSYGYIKGFAIIDDGLFQVNNYGHPEFESDDLDFSKKPSYLRVAPDIYQARRQAETDPNEKKSTMFYTLTSAKTLYREQYDKKGKIEVTEYYKLATAYTEQTLPVATKEKIIPVDASGNWKFEYEKRSDDFLQVVHKGDSITIKLCDRGNCNVSYRKTYTYKKTSVNTYEYKSDKGGTGRLIFLSPTRICLSFVYKKNYVSVGFYNKPAAPPIVKQENKPVTENKTVSSNSAICGKWSTADKNAPSYGSYIIEVTCTGDKLSIRYEKDLSKYYQGTLATGTITTAQKTSDYKNVDTWRGKTEITYHPSWSGICPFKTENEQANLPGTWIYFQDEDGVALILKVGNYKINFYKVK